MPRKLAPTQSRRLQNRNMSNINARPTATVQIAVRDDDMDGVANSGGEPLELGGDDDGTSEMFALLKEIQKRKSAKTSTRSTAFQTEKADIYTEARKTAGAAMEDGLAYLESFKATVAEIKSQQISQETRLTDLKHLLRTNDETITSMMSSCNPIIIDLSNRRASHTDDTSALLEAHLAERQASRRRLMKNATTRMEDNIEKQKVITDANALIKHYTAILLS